MPEFHSSNKLLKHLDRVDEWDKKGYTFPILADFDLSNKCNNHCPLCIAEGRDETIVKLKDAKRIISELKDCGVEAMIYGGGGEPSCNPDLEKILEFTREKGMEIGMFTNAYELSDSLIREMIKDCTWIRVSLDADSPGMYKKTHGMGWAAWNQVQENISELVMERESTESKAVIGNCYLIGPHTVSGIYNAAKLSSEFGVDYIRFRPYFEWEDSKKISPNQKERMIQELEKAKALRTDIFDVSVSEDRCEATGESRKRNYCVCYVHNFMTSITPDLNMYTCCVFKNTKREDKYCLGNLKENSFKDIWMSEKRRKIHEKIDLKDCPNPCQFEKYNEFLYLVKQKMMHENFL